MLPDVAPRPAPERSESHFIPDVDDVVPPEPAETIGAMLDDFHAAAAGADRERYFAHLSDDAVFLGTDATERWTKAEFEAYAAPHFTRGKAWTFRATRRAITVDATGVVAWFDEDLTTENLGPARGSGVATWDGEAWQIAQYNLALTIPNDRFPMVKIAAGSALLATAKDDPAASAAALLAGSWVAEREGGERVEEHWTSSAGGALLGVGRSVKDGRTTFFELLRIEARDGALVYVAQPRGEKATEFRRVPRADGSLVFENPKHDWPKRISYKKTDTGLSVRIEGSDKQRVETLSLRPAVIDHPRR